jgi:serralysin
MGSRWDSTSPTGQSPLVIAFSFPSDGAFYVGLFGNYGSNENTTGFVPCNSTQQTAIREILTWYGRFMNVVFVEMTETATDHATIRYGNSSVPTTSYAYYPSGNPEGGDVWFGTGTAANQNPVKGTYGHATSIHETGHTLGLKHPHDSLGGFGAMSTTIDEFSNSLMSYRTHINGGLSWGGVETYGYPQTPMRFDIAALQYMYGANYHYSDGDTTYSWDETTGQFKINGTAFGAAPGANRVFMCLWDGGGTDTFDVSNYGSATIDLTPGAWSTLASSQLASVASGVSAPGNVSVAYRYQSSTQSDIERHTP